MNKNNIDRLIGNDYKLLIKKIKQCKSIKELNLLRIEIAEAMTDYLTEETFKEVQHSFTKHKGKLKRTPLDKRPQDWK